MSSLGFWAGPYQTFAQKQKLMFLCDHPVLFYARPLNSQLLICKPGNGPLIQAFDDPEGPQVHQIRKLH